MQEYGTTVTLTVRVQAEDERDAEQKIQAVFGMQEAAPGVTITLMTYEEQGLQELST